MDEMAGFLAQYGSVISSFLIGISSNLSTDVIKTMSMYEISNLKSYFSSKKFDIEAFTNYAKSPDGLRTLSVVIDKVRSEIFAAKIETWGTITSSVISGKYDKDSGFNKRDYFIAKFAEMNDFTVQFLAELGKADYDYTKMYETVNGGNRVLAGKEPVVLAQIFLNVNGFCELYQISNPPNYQNMLRLSPLGREFLQFVHAEFEKIVNN